jgi:hypothetical protein
MTARPSQKAEVHSQSDFGLIYLPLTDQPIRAEASDDGMRVLILFK